jgi:hypothetical protein
MINQLLVAKLMHNQEEMSEPGVNGLGKEARGEEEEWLLSKDAVHQEERDEELMVPVRGLSVEDIGKIGRELTSSRNRKKRS